MVKRRKQRIKRSSTQQISLLLMGSSAFASGAVTSGCKLNFGGKSSTKSASASLVQAIALLDDATAASCGKVLTDDDCKALVPASARPVFSTNAGCEQAYGTGSCSSISSGDDVDAPMFMPIKVATVSIPSDQAPSPSGSTAVDSGTSGAAPAVSSASGSAAVDRGTSGAAPASPSGNLLDVPVDTPPAQPAPPAFVAFQPTSDSPFAVEHFDYDNTTATPTSPYAVAVTITDQTTLTTPATQLQNQQDGVVASNFNGGILPWIVFIRPTTWVAPSQRPGAANWTATAYAWNSTVGKKLYPLDITGHVAAPTTAWAGTAIRASGARGSWGANSITTGGFGSFGDPTATRSGSSSMDGEVRDGGVGGRSGSSGSSGGRGGSSESSGGRGGGVGGDSGGG